jgi:pyruvate kinase
MKKWSDTEKESEIKMRKTKIIATIGPSIASEDMILRMAKAGVDGFRINYSHGTRDEWKKYIESIRRAEKETGKPIAILGDLQGPNPRIGFLEKPLYIKAGDQVVLEYGERFSGELKKIPVPHKEVFQAVDEGDILLLDDGRLQLKVIEKGENRLVAKALSDGKLVSRKSVSAEGKEIPLPLITEKDENDILFSIENDVDYILASFVESAEHLRRIKQKLAQYGGEQIPVYAKIETRDGVLKSGEIVREADGIVVARGDLGTHFPLEKIPLLQKQLVELAREKGKPVCVATQLLTSMVTQTIPTRSEVVDVYNAVVEDVDSLMLTNETAIGEHPLETIFWLDKIIRESESVKKESTVQPNIEDFNHRLAEGVVSLANNLGAKIVVYTMSGRTAGRLSMYRPARGIYAGTPSIKAARKLSVLWGIAPIMCEAEKYMKGLDEAYKKLMEKQMIVENDILVETYKLKEEPRHYITLRVKKAI